MQQKQTLFDVTVNILQRIREKLEQKNRILYWCTAIRPPRL
jgi:hypothetical protein